MHTEDETEAKKKMNEGALELRRLFPDRGGPAEVARLCGANPSAVSRWFTGDRTPDTKMRARLQEKTGVDWRLFDREVERDAKEPAA